MLDSGQKPAIRVSSLSEERGFVLNDDMEVNMPVIFLNDQFYLWSVPPVPTTDLRWSGWTKDHLQIFEIVTPKPGPSSVALNHMPRNKLIA